MRDTRMDMNRRSLLIGLLTSLPGLATAKLAPTPRQTAGPFYPWATPEYDDADLTRVPNQALAKGEHTRVTGRVLLPNGEALRGARVEIWQCDAVGRYHHVRDGGRTPMDAGFQGYGFCDVDNEGAYVFRTIKPVPYAGRTPHIHLRVLDDQGRERLTTQVYVAGEPRNARDGIYDASLAVAFEPHDGDGLQWAAEFNPVVQPRA